MKKKNKDNDYRKVTRLSDSFLTKGGDLEMKVNVYNINYGRNWELMEKCKTLQDYSVLIHRIRVYNKEENSKESAVDRAIDECVKEHPSSMMEAGHAKNM